MKTVLFFPQAKTKENFYLGNLSRTISQNYEVIGVNFAGPTMWLNHYRCKILDEFLSKKSFTTKIQM